MIASWDGLQDGSFLQGHQDGADVLLLAMELEDSQFKVSDTSKPLTFVQLKQGLLMMVTWMQIVWPSLKIQKQNQESSE